MSRIEITGNLAADPEYALGKDTSRPYSRFTVVVNYRTKDPDGTWSDGGRVGYRVVVFDQLADNVTNSLHKGDRVTVTGDYTVRDYQTSDGSRGSSHEIRNATVGVSLDYATVTVTRNPKPAPADQPTS